MPPPQPNRKPPARPSPSRTPARPAPNQPQSFEVVDPIWLLKALAAAVLAAVVCAWLALCLLYYQGSWQLVLHPGHTVDRTPATLNLPFDELRFDAAPTGQPRLTGWWIPASAPSSQLALHTPPRFGSDVVLYLHDGAGSLSGALPTLALLHQSGVNVFALDYRGFGRSDSSAHPTSASMAADAAAALDYLTATRHIPADRIAPYGAGLGAALAVTLAHAHPELRAVILDNPDPDPSATAVAAHSSHLVPIRLLYHEHFDIAAPLAALTTPKLLIAGGPNARAATDPPALPALFRTAASPHFSVDLPARDPDPALIAALSRFLDQYLPPEAPDAPPKTR